MDTATNSGIRYAGLPTHLVDGMRRYIEDGIKPGGFLVACLDNDLARAVSRASNPDELIAVMRFLTWEAPASCWGGQQFVTKWLSRGGLNGRAA